MAAKGLAHDNRLKVAAFVAAIGIPVRQEARVEGFIPGVRIVDGGLVWDERTTASNLLHEAGHLAVTPAVFRAWMNDDLSVAWKRMMQALNDEPVDSPLLRAFMQSSETEATAWAWAAGKHLGLAEEAIIEDADFNGEGADVRDQLHARQYLGINGLGHAGFCSRGSLDLARGVPAYPTLAFWLQGGRAEEACWDDSDEARLHGRRADGRAQPAPSFPGMAPRGMRP